MQGIDDDDYDDDIDHDDRETLPKPVAMREPLPH